jgi:hypothetical protein
VKRTDFISRKFRLNFTDGLSLASSEFRFHGRQSHEALDDLLLGHYST